MRITTLSEQVYRDVRLGVRALVARRLWSVAALACLAIAMGSSTAAFTIVRALFFRPLPFSDPAQLVMVAVGEQGKGPRPFTVAQYTALAESSGADVQLIARSYAPVSVSSNAEPDATGAEAEIVSANYFHMLRVAPFLGEFFGAGSQGNEAVAVLSYRLWSARFHGDANAIGSSMRIGGVTARVIGVAPPHFSGATSLIASDLWMPISQYAAITGSASNPPLSVMGRLADGLTTRQAEAELTAHLADGAALNPNKDTVIIRPASGFGVPIAMQGPVLAVSTFIYIVLTLLMAVACANVAALVLARSTTQWRDVAIRRSLGASFARVASQSLAEACVLCVAGAAVGGLVATWLTTFAARSLPSPFGYVSFAVDVKPDRAVFGYAVAASVIATVWCSVAPIWIASKIDVRECLSAAGRGHTRSSHRVFSTIIGAQFATSAVLLIVAAQLIHGYVRSARASLPYDAAHVVALTIDYGRTRKAPTGSLFEDVERQTLRVRGVSGVSAISTLPLAQVPSVTVSRGERLTESGAAAGLLWAGPSYFTTLGTRMVGGRDFSREDARDHHGVIVNDALARRLWPSGAPIGQTVRITDSGHVERLQVIGVAPDLNEEDPDGTPRPMLYRPTEDMKARELYLLARVEIANGAMLESLRQSLQGSNDDVSAIDVKTLEEWQSSIKDQKKMPTIALTAVGILGLILSVIGVYGVVSYHVRERRREIGVRLALGASSARVIGQVLSQGLRAVIYGLTAGCAGAFAAGELLRNRVYGVALPSVADAAIIFALLVAVACCALYLPARYASKISPWESLHVD